MGGRLREEFRYSSVAERRLRAPELGRASDLARELGVSGNQIYMWNRRKATNGFPDPVACTWSPWRGDRYGSRPLWEIEAVLEWFKEYDPRANQARGGGRNPNGRRGKND